MKGLAYSETRLARTWAVLALPFDPVPCMTHRHPYSISRFCSLRRDTISSRSVKQEFCWILEANPKAHHFVPFCSRPLSTPSVSFAPLLPAHPSHRELVDRSAEELPKPSWEVGQHQMRSWCHTGPLVQACPGPANESLICSAILLMF